MSYCDRNDEDDSGSEDGGDYADRQHDYDDNSGSDNSEDYTDRQEDDNSGSGSGSDDDDDEEQDRRTQRNSASQGQYRSRDAPSGQYELTEPGQLPPPPDPSGDRPYPGDYIEPSSDAQTSYDSYQTWDANVGPTHIQSGTASRVQPPAARSGEAYYEYSQMTGNRKALLIGINYLDFPVGKGGLQGCENDVKNMERYLTERCNYDPSDIRVLTEDSEPQSHLTQRSMVGNSIVFIRHR
ncbi:hypothetical protein C8R44DRAFT_724440 [Mycena epipterygia]|nr:hypothetical protein C8R44DRAFT_724440 [Mycena epipterygia]